MKLVKNGVAVADPWVAVAEDEAIPPGRPAILTLDRYRREAAALAGREAPLGLRLKPAERPLELAGTLARFALIVLEFPTFRDGRGYSQAMVLRTQLGFKGEIRAAGDILRDQIQPMLRCGIDAFEVADSFPLEAFAHAPGELSVFYQPAADGTETIFERRKRLRRL